MKKSPLIIKLEKFAFEIDLYQSGSLTPGWLVVDNETDFYLLGWIDVIEELVLKGSRLKIIFYYW